jgi:thiamine pyrophosphokinase
MSPRVAWLVTQNSPAEIFSSYASIDPEQDLVIAVDQGLEQVERLGLIPDLIIGDMDSADEELLARHGNCEIMRYPARKDETDTELALDWCERKGIKQIVICNDMGGRFDHAFALIQNLLRLNDSGISCRIESRDQRLWLLQPETDLDGLEGCLLSLLSLCFDSRFEGSEGLEYPLDGLVLHHDLTRGISNRITKDRASIRLLSGSVLAVLTK